MRPLNQTERNSLTLKFVVLFVVAVVLVGITIYFNFGTYKRLGDQQVQKLSAYNSYVKNEKKILTLMDTLNKQIEVLGNTNVNSIIVVKGIVDQIKFSDFANKDTSSIKILKALDEVYAKLLDLKDKSESNSRALKKAEDENRKLKTDHADEIKRLKEDYELDLKRATLP